MASALFGLPPSPFFFGVRFSLPLFVQRRLANTLQRSSKVESRSEVSRVVVMEEMEEREVHWSPLVRSTELRSFHM